MTRILSSVVFAICLPWLASAAYGDAFLVEFDGSVQLSPESLMSQTKNSLAATGSDCTASERYHFTHSAFQGISFNLNCANDRITREAVLAIIQSIDGVQKAWPVLTVNPAAFEDHMPTGRYINHDFGPPARRDLSRAFNPRDGTADTLSTHVDTGVAKLHAANLTGSGLRIAVIDTGFDLDVVGLSGVNIAYSHDLTDDDNDVRDNCSYHGTHVLGIIGAKGDEARYGVRGVAPDATYELYRIQPCTPGLHMDLLIKSFLEAADRGVDIITCSYGIGLAFPEDPWSVVATRLFENGTYISLPSGNTGPGIFSASSPSAADAVTSVGSADNSFTPYLTWEGNLTAGNDTSAFRFIPGLPFNLPAHNKLTLWSPNQDIDIGGSEGCQLLPDSSTLPADRSNVVLLAQYLQCWKNATGDTVSLTNTLGIPYAVLYSSKDSTVSNGPGFVEDREDPNLRGAVLVEHRTGVKLLEAFHKDSAAVVQLANEVSVANAVVENRLNNRTGLLTSGFSSWGPSLTARSLPLFLAPGGNILSTFPGRLGGYGVLSGTSMATPFAAGVAALVKQSHPDYSPQEIQTVIATTARPVYWTTSDFLAPVFQQGGGLVDAWNAIHSTTVLSTPSLAFNDTTNRPKELRFSIKNTGSTGAITYQLSHIGAGSGYILKAANGYEYTGAEAVPVYADVSIAPATVKVEPGKSVTVSVSVTKNPDLPEAATRISYFGGYIAIQADGGPFDVNNLSLPYTGFGSPLTAIPIINKDFSYLMAWNMTSSTPTKIEEGRVFTCTLNTSADLPASFPDNMFPGVWIDPFMQTRELIINIVDPESKRVVVETHRTSSEAVWGSGAEWYWDGSAANKTPVAEGTYVWQLKSLKLNGYPEKEEDWEIFETGKWVLEYSNGTALPSGATF